MLGKEILKKKYLLILGYSGTITIGLGMALIINLITALFYVTPSIEIEATLVIGFASMLVGYLMKIPMKKVEDKSLSVQEGGIIVVFTWILATIIGGAPFVYTGQLNFTQASF
jgi:trk system potassium uptake protein TrkH